MDVTIRDATAGDAPYLARVVLAAARSHRPIGFWDLALPGPEQPRLDTVADIMVAEPRGFVHYSGFIIAEHEARPVAALSAYDAAEKSFEKMSIAMAGVLQRRGWSDVHQELLLGRCAPAISCMPDSVPGVWTVEFVAAEPEARGHGVVNRLLGEILDRGRSLGYTTSHISIVINNVPAQRAYERVGFRTKEEFKDDLFEEVFGEPGIARMETAL